MLMPTSLLPWLATWLLHSAILCALALAVTRVLRSPRARQLVCKGALLGAFLTTGLQGWVSRAPADLRLEVPAAQARVEHPGPAGAPISVASPGSAQPGARPDAPAAVAAAPLAVPGAEEHVAAPWATALVLAWLAVAGFVLVRLARTQQRLHRALAHRRRLEHPRARRLLKGLTRGGKPLGVRLSVCPGLDAPLALGRREIILPERITELDDGELEGLLAHELAHLSRRDPQWSLVAHVLQSIFFPQVLLRSVRRRLAADAELCCDAWAAQRMGRPRDLARGLAHVAGWVDQARPRPVLAAGVGSSRSALVERVERLLTPAPRHRADRLGGAAVLMVALGAVAWAAPVVSVPESPRGAQEPPGQMLGAVAKERTAKLTLDIGPLGGVRAAQTVLVDPETAAGKEDPYDDVSVWLKEEASKMPVREHGDLSFPDGSLLLRSHASAPFVHLQHIMQRCADADVRIWRLSMGVGEGAPVPAHLPIDVGVSLRLLENERVELLIKVNEAGVRVDPVTGAPWSGSGDFTYDDTRSLFYLIGPRRMVTLDEVSKHLQELVEAGRFDPLREGGAARINLDTRGGVDGPTAGEVVAVLQLMRELGLEGVTFTGTFESPTAAYEARKR